MVCRWAKVSGEKRIILLIVKHVWRPMQQIYETDRLILKTLDGTSAADAADYFARNRDFLRIWEPSKSGEFYTAARQRELLAEEQKSMDEERSLRLWIFKKDEPCRIIGALGFHNIVYGAFCSCHMGYKLDEGEINKGYATEAAKKGIEIMFSRYGLHRIEANIMPKNARSLRVAQKLGFYNEGLARQYLKINGKWEDHYHMVLLNERV